MKEERKLGCVFISVPIQIAFIDRHLFTNGSPEVFYINIYISVHMQALIMAALPPHQWTNRSTYKDTLVALSTCAASCVESRRLHFKFPSAAAAVAAVAADSQHNVSRTCLVIYVDNEGSAAVEAAL